MFMPQITTIFFYPAILLIALLNSVLPANASDHVDGEITIKHPVADISDLYVFMSPTRPDNLVLVLNSYPIVPTDGHFSDRLQYSFMLKPVQAQNSGSNTVFSVADTTYRIDCSFTTPHDTKNHSVKCAMPNGQSIQGTVNKVTTDQTTRLFAGKRADPFLFDAGWFSKIVFDYCIPPSNASNNLKSSNVLSIVLEVNTKTLFQDEPKGLFAVAAQIAQTEAPYKILDRVGRPEISNAHLVTGVGQQDLRTLYNQEISFAVNPVNKALYIERLKQNIAYYDSLDGHQDWPSYWRNDLSQILVNDYLLIDTRKPFSQFGYFDVEHSALRSQPHTRSVGRTPCGHAINALMRLLVNGGHGQAINDGIPAKPIRHDFPYLAKAHTGLLTKVIGFFAPKFIAPIALRERVPKKKDASSPYQCGE
jgi:hypothetical protein